ncbi:MAG TPA: biotin carboxylase N-terminal domain-containing protein [Acidocella sp.]|nr:MAG: methylcrotonoyl-CoA carboxylase [Rhodospirillales bacterium 20-58-10]HQT37898.1 biotin carboxylase N-terminal domain-containing protein [Acidocella sp.]
MFPSVLIANRGEIARRIIRTARRMGVRSIAVYSQADATAPFVAEADQAIAIGPAAARESYLDVQKILAAAHASDASAIHPGYGFLSENAEFAEAVLQAGLIWIGPRPASIRAMGLKDAAKALMIRAGVPTTPGYVGDDQSDSRLTAEALHIGYPILIKAVAGGGGKGMRKVVCAEDFPAALVSCRREARAAFNDDRVLLEKYVTRPRHIEVQIFGDAHGHMVHLFERDCSVQRRHQKVIEEAPAPGMTESVRASVCATAVQAARAVSYEGAGTVEFIADASNGLRADRIWFMEMNTRLQVEHPVTEAVTGQDLVEWQFRVANGEALPLAQDQITMKGHAIEARLYAESPETGFLPSIGTLRHFKLATHGIRVDSAVEQGSEVTPFYDPMIAKLIAHAPTRAMAVGQLAAACGAAEIWPVKTNAAFLANALMNVDFMAGGVDTGFIDTHVDTLVRNVSPTKKVLEVAAASLLETYHIPPALIGFRLNANPHVAVRLQSGGDIHTIDFHSPVHSQNFSVAKYDGEIVVFEGGRTHVFSEVTTDASLAAIDTSDGAVVSPMPGHILSLAVTEGDRVTKGTALLVMEAMKMEMILAAPIDGIVTSLGVKVGDRVAEGITLLRLQTGD